MSEPCDSLLAAASISHLHAAEPVRPCQAQPSPVKAVHSERAFALPRIGWLEVLCWGVQDTVLLLLLTCIAMLPCLVEEERGNGKVW